MGATSWDGRLLELPRERQSQWLWIYICKWSTSPIPFSAAHLAEVADVPLDEAKAAIQGAVDRDWLVTLDKGRTFTKCAKPPKVKKQAAARR